MLNRIYIVVGLFAIVILAGAFFAPRFIQWSDYRDRMEELASEVLGADVTIRGGISFSLLPTPRLEFSDVVVGDAEAPAATVGEVEAEFALFDFLRDNYTVTGLTLARPVVDLVLDENGLFSSGIDLSGAGAGVDLRQAGIVDGSFRLTDLRADEVFTVRRVDGELRLSSFTGPFQFQGGADYGEARYDVRLGTGQADANGVARFSGSVRQAGGAFSFSAEGNLTAGIAPRFEGNLVYRQTPPPAENADEITGDMVLTSDVTASTDRVVLTGYTLNPDENRTGMRLTGTASIQLGARRSFDAVVSGGVFSLPPRPATEIASELPYEFVRLLGEIPPPPIPPMAGTVDVDLAEIALRGFTLRDLRLDATTDGATWQVEQAIASLPGETELRLSGSAGSEGGALTFLGDVSVAAQRLDALSQIWRRPGEDSPLFNTPGRLEGRLMLGRNALGLNNGRFDYAGQSHAAEFRLGFGAEPRLDATLRLGTLDTAQTEGLLALLPDIGNAPSFSISFPVGSFSLTAAAADVLGLPASELVAEGSWSPDDVRFARLATTDWGGVGLDTRLDLKGSLADPRVTGSGDVDIAAADAPGLVALYEMAGVPFGWQEGLGAALPADLSYTLADNASDAGQVLTLAGTLGAANLDLRAELAAGLSQLTGGDLRLIASLEAEDALKVQDQLGLGSANLFPGDGSLLASLFMEGSADDGFEGRVGISQGQQSLNYFGRLTIAPNGEVGGEGTLDAVLTDASGLAALAGLEGASLPSIDANAALRFAGLREIALQAINGVSGSVPFTGALSVQRAGQTPTISGTIDASSMDALGIARALFGNEALAVPGAAIWPEGPLATAASPRASRGEVTITADAVTAADSRLAGPTRFTYAWTSEQTAIDNLSAQMGGGTLELNLVRCCAGGLTDRTVSGRLSLAGVDLDTVLGPFGPSGLGGALTAALQFEGTGPSLAEVMRRMTGEGNLAIADFTAAQLSPAVFPSMAGLDDALNTAPDALETLISLALSQGPFTASEARGAFTVAGGTARLANLIVDGDGGQLAGSLNFGLDRLGLDGTFVLTPRDFADPAGLIEADTARIIARLAGTLLAPTFTLDLSEMAAAIQVRANELEVDRLEQLRLEDEARQREAAEARNRLVEQQRRQAEEAAAQRAAEEEAQRRLLEQQSQPAPPPPAATPAPPSPFQFEIPPNVNQPFGSGVNQPF